MVERSLHMRKVEGSSPSGSTYILAPVFMKIVFLSSAIFPSIGGVQTHVLRISEELVRRGHSITIITELTPDFNHSKKYFYQSRGSSVKAPLILKKLDKSIYSYDLSKNKIHVIGIKFGKNSYTKKIKIWLKLWKMRKYFLDADLVHCHDVYIWYFPFRILFPWKKSYITFHGYEGIVPPKKNAVLIRKISNELARASILVGSYIRKWYGTNSPFVTYGGVERNKIFTYRHVKKELRILMIGRLDRDIGVQTYVAILNHLKELGIRYKCVVLGDGPMRSTIEKYAVVKGFVNDVSYLLDHSDIVFASSYLSILESLIRKKMVVGVYENALKKDYLKPVSQFIISGDDASDLALEIEKFLKHKRQYSGMIEKGYSWAKDQTWSRVADTYEKLWKK